MLKAIGVASIDEQARCEDKLTSSFVRMQLTMNIMLYGLNERTIEDTVLKKARTYFHDATRIVAACLGQYNQVPEKVLLSSHQDANNFDGDMHRIINGSLPN